jgi:hypothetical protein
MGTTDTAPDRAGPAPSDRAVELDALPVELALAGPEATRIAGWVEGMLGWQPVAGATSLPARLRLADPAGAAPLREPAAAAPLLLLVAADDGALAVAAAVARRPPDAVLRWPADRDELPAAAARLLDRPGADPVSGDLRVGGAAGGVGTTTVALAIGALVAWRSGPALVVTHGAVPLDLPRTVEVGALAGPRTWPEAHPVPGVPRLRVVRTDRVPVDAAALAAPGPTVVRDLGIHDDVDVLVARRDRAGLAAVDRSPAAVVVVRDDGPAPLGALRAAAGGRRTILLPPSVRVARAAWLRRVPVALPGSFLRALTPVLPRPPDARG